MGLLTRAKNGLAEPASSGTCGSGAGLVGEASRSVNECEVELVPVVVRAAHHREHEDHGHRGWRAGRPCYATGTRVAGVTQSASRRHVVGKVLAGCCQHPCDFDGVPSRWATLRTLTRTSARLDSRFRGSPGSGCGPCALGRSPIPGNFGNGIGRAATMPPRNESRNREGDIAPVAQGARPAPRESRAADYLRPHSPC